MLASTDIKFFKLAVGLDRIGKETEVDISARCPVCGDSKKRKNLKRLHLYNKGEVTNISCFNEGCEAHNKTVFSFLRDFFPNLLPQYKRENFTQTMKNLGNSGDVFKKIKTKKIVTEDLSQHFIDISEVPEALEYLKSRGHKYNKSFGKWYFGKENLKIAEKTYNIKDSIIIPLYKEGKMYGFYSRSIKDKVFYTYIPEKNIGYKIWNWFNVNKKEVYIFEGIFDAIASGLPNSIALLGASLPEERLKEIDKPIFVLDNDKTGLLNSLKYSKLGYSIYVQPEELEEKDMNELKLNNPTLDISKMIKDNIFENLSAAVRIKSKL